MRDQLLQILSQNASAEALAWLQKVIASQEETFERRPFYYAFSGVSRHFDKRGQIDPTTAEDADFSLQGWDEFRLARCILLLTLAGKSRDEFLETLAALRNTADIRELVAIYSTYPLLPYPEELVESAVDGLRSNIEGIFDSIALDNAFPAEHFSDEEWNQMVLKAIFINRPLYRITGMDERANERLALAISDLAHERWAAGREITPEAWRGCIGHLESPVAADIERLAQSESNSERRAAELVKSADNSDESWDNLGRSLLS